LSQVEKSIIEERLSTINYDRFSSLLMQIESVININKNINNILEIGPGNQFFSNMIKMLGYDIKTNDVRKRTNPDYYGDIRKINIEEKFDLIVAFEVLQHLPFEELSHTLNKLKKMTNHYILLSLPYQIHSFSFNIKLPNIFFPRKLKLDFFRKKFSINFFWEKPRKKDTPYELLSQREDFWNPHYWEIGRKSFPKSKVIDEIKSSGLSIVWEKHNPSFPMHYFILLSI